MCTWWGCPRTANVATPHQAHHQPCGQPLPSTPKVENFPMLLGARGVLGVTVLCAARVQTERLAMFGWGAFAWDWGLVRDAGCCGRPCSFIAASPSALLQNNL